MYLIFEGVVCKVKKKFYKTVKVEKNDITYLDRCFFVDYYILETQKSTERHGYIKSFGIEAVKRYTDYFENNVSQEDRAYDITQSENELYAFAEKLARHTVTPVCLADAVSDFIGEEEPEKSAV